jgi:hypothetical protein
MDLPRSSRFGCLLLPLAACAAAPHPAPAAATGIEAAAWLTGRWLGRGFGGEVEETWAPAVGGTMVGHFRLVQNGAPVFYELMLLDAPEGTLRLRVKHFGADFVGWEEKDGCHTFVGSDSAADALRFDGLVLRRTGVDRAEFVVSMRGEDGSVRDEVLQLQRAPR